MSTPLVLIAHGSRSRSWVRAVEELVAGMDDRLSASRQGELSGCIVAFLENASPSVDEALNALAVAKEGAAAGPRAVALPLLLTASAHLREDVPEQVAGRATVLAPLEPSEWLAGNLLRRLQGILSDHALGRVGVVVVAYGSSEYPELWESLLTEVEQRLRARGVGAASHAFVGHVVGLSPEPTAAAIEGLATEHPSLTAVVVLPALFSCGMLQTGPIQAAVDRAQRTVDAEVLYAADAILPDPHLGDLLVDYALDSTAGGGKVARG